MASSAMQQWMFEFGKCHIMCLMQGGMRFRNSALRILSLWLDYTYATCILSQSIQGTISNDVDNSAALDTLNPTTFASAYKAVNQVLVTVVQDSRLRNLSSSDMVQFSGRIVDTWVKLTRITQTLDASLSRSMLIVALRSGLTMTDLFAKTILPLLAACFFTHRDEIVAVLERMRKATRILQSVCNYPKTSQDTKLQSAVPQTKRKLEQLIFQVYVLMGNNDSMSALTLGRLKHLIVRSEDVSLQILRDYESEDNESETESDQAENDQLESESNDNVPDPAPVQAKGGRSVIVRSKVDK